MNLSKYVDPARCLQLVLGVAGIYVSYLVTGVIHESMLKKTYENDITHQQEQFKWAAGFLIFPCGITYIIGALVNYFQIPKDQRTNIPHKNSAICGLTVAISTLTYTYAIYLTNFPVVMMFKSCNILSVILVGVMCSRVKDKKLKLGTKKIVVGVLVTLGIILFKVTDPNSFKEDGKKTELVGIVLLIVSLLADGFLPDFQAQIKSEYKPQPMEMMTSINMWVSIISILYSTVLMELWDMIMFIATHQKFLVHMLLMGFLSTIGQMFVYYMIKQFKQHFVPFVITTRKIFTVGLSIIIYGHETNIWQIFGLFLVFGMVTYEFVSELMGEKKEQQASLTSENVELPKVGASTLMVEAQVEPSSRQQDNKQDLTGQVEQKQNQLYQKRMAGEHAQNRNVIRPAFQTTITESKA